MDSETNRPVPTITWIAMGLQSGNFFETKSIDYVTALKPLNEIPKVGAWNGFLTHAYKPNSTQEMEILAKESIKKSIMTFIEHPLFASEFFVRKIAYMWADSSYFTTPDQNEKFFFEWGPQNFYSIKTTSNMARCFLDNQNVSRQTIHALGGGWLTLLHLSSSFGFVFLFYDKDAGKDAGTLCVTLTFLLGFVFYMFWEVSPRYALIFVPFLVLISAYGIVKIIDKVRRWHPDAISLRRCNNHSGVSMGSE